MVIALNVSGRPMVVETQTQLKDVVSMEHLSCVRKANSSLGFIAAEVLLPLCTEEIRSIPLAEGFSSSVHPIARHCYPRSKTVTVDLFGEHYFAFLVYPLAISIV